jgi:splicing suppressor protein 51
MEPACTICNKSPPEVTLKRCAKCSQTPYCSRDCQKADWKAHKKICGRQANDTSSSSDRSGAAKLSPPRGLKQGIADPFSRLDNGTWLHGRPESDVYGLLIDAYRLNVEDMYNMEGEADEDSIYGGAPDGLHGFQRFLKKVARRPGLLPPWWSPARKRACEDLGMTRGQYYSLASPVEKSDIIENYGDSQFPMQLRMFSEAVYGRAPGGSNGSMLRQMLMAMEQGEAGDMMMQGMDMSSMFSRR